MFIKKSFKTLLLVVLVLALSGFTYGLAAANTVPATKAGDGQGAITGYTVSNIVYHLNTSNPSEIASISFTLSAAATTAYIQLNSTWYPVCNITGGTAVDCPTTGALVSTAATLQVVAAN